MVRRDSSVVGSAFDETDWKKDENVTEWGGDLFFTVGETSGGAPFGPTIEELKLSEERDFPSAGWVRAKRAFRHAFEDFPNIGSITT